MLDYMNLSRRHYYQPPKSDRNFTALTPDEKVTLAILARGSVKLLGIGLRALIVSLLPGNKYGLPR